MVVEAAAGVDLATLRSGRPPNATNGWHPAPASEKCGMLTVQRARSGPENMRQDTLPAALL